MQTLGDSLNDAAFYLHAYRADEVSRLTYEQLKAALITNYRAFDAEA